MIADAKALTDVLKAAAAQKADQVTVRPGADGWNITAVSPDRVSMIDARILPGAFAEYTEWDTFAVGVDILLDALASVGPSPDIDISDGRLTVRGNGLTVRRQLYTPEDTPLRFPQLALTAEVMVPAERIALIVSKGDDRFGTCTFAVSGDGLRVSSLDEQGLGVTLDIPADDCVMIAGEGTASYPLNAWIPFIKAVPKGADLHISLDTNMPLLAEYSSDGCEVRWLVAPHISE